MGDPALRPLALGQTTFIARLRAEHWQHVFRLRAEMCANISEIYKAGKFRICKVDINYKGGKSALFTFYQGLLSPFMQIR